MAVPVSFKDSGSFGISILAVRSLFLHIIFLCRMHMLWNGTSGKCGQAGGWEKPVRLGGQQ